MEITFEKQAIQIGRGAHRQETIEALVGVGTGMAAHLAPEWSVLSHQCPGAWMVSNVERGSSVTCGLLPGDEETARALITYLDEQRESGVRTMQLIEQFAAMGGCWRSLEPSCP